MFGVLIGSLDYSGFAVGVLYWLIKNKNGIEILVDGIEWGGSS